VAVAVGASNQEHVDEANEHLPQLVVMLIELGKRLANPEETLPSPYCPCPRLPKPKKRQGQG